MNLRHLRHFVAVAEELHFTRAAERAGIEQSPLSRSIKNLEARLGVVLFERTKRSTRLTAAGERLFIHAKSLLAAVDDARVDVRAAGSGSAHHLRIGICDGVPLLRVARLLVALKQESPDICVHVHEVTMMQKVYELRNGHLDAVLAPESAPGKGVISESIWQDHPVAVVPRNHPLSGRESISLAAIVQAPLVLCQPDVGVGQIGQIEQIVRSVTPTPDIVNRTTTLSVLVALVLAGYGIGIATAGQLEAVSPEGLVFRPLRDAPGDVKTWLLTRDEPSPEPLARLVEQARQIT